MAELDVARDGVEVVFQSYAMTRFSRDGEVEMAHYFAAEFTEKVVEEICWLKGVVIVVYIHFVT